MSIFNPLVSLLNQQHELLANWHSSSSAQLMTALLPWLLRDASQSISARRNDTILDCSSELYSNALTGQRKHEAKTIIDFVPFGYDIDKLEIRFHEIYDVVDAFVIYESPLTQTALDKPIIFPLLVNTSRFSKFMDKVIYLQASKGELQKFEQETRKELKKSKINWALENSMRSEMLRKFILDDSPLKRKLMAGNNIYATQNDADEIPLRDVRYLLNFILSN